MGDRERLLLETWSATFSDCKQYMEDGVLWRVLTLKDGGAKVKEKLTDADERSYNYSITDAPLPITDHKGKLWVEDGAKPGTSRPPKRSLAFYVMA